jgi:hypothetical protein
MARSYLGVAVLVVLLAGLRWVFPERPPDYTGPRALLDASFALGLLGLILLLAGGLGRKVLLWLRLEGLTPLEKALFGLPVGLGILAYGVLALSLVGTLKLWTMLLWLAVAGLWSWREWSEIVGRLPGWLVEQSWRWRRLSLEKRLLLLVISLILILAMAQALTPPWNYDGLMYYLQAPRLFLKAERIVLLSDIWQANGPFTIQMLYMLGLAGGSDLPE